MMGSTIKYIKNLRKKLSEQMRNFYFIKKAHQFVYFILIDILYRFFYKGFVYLTTTKYLDKHLKYTNFTCYKKATQSNIKDFHGNGCFYYCSAVTPQKQKVFIKVGNNIGALKKEPRLIKRFYNVANKDLKCLKVVKNVDNIFVNFLATNFIDGITFKSFILGKDLKSPPKTTKIQQTQILSQLRIILDKLNEAGIYATKTCATHMDNILVSKDKESNLYLTLIDFEKYIITNPNCKKAKKLIERNVKNITYLVEKTTRVLNINKKELQKYFGEYL